MQFTKSARCLLVAAGLAAASMTTTASAQTAFTYQGVLEESGSPVTGLESIRFRIYDAPTGGTLIGETTQNVDVADGVFTTQLNFGPLNTIDPSTAWLELAVDTGSGYEVLGRQQITSAPFATNTRGMEVSANASTITFPLGSDAELRFFEDDCCPGITGDSTALGMPGHILRLRSDLEIHNTGSDAGSLDVRDGSGNARIKLVNEAHSDATNRIVLNGASGEPSFFNAGNVGIGTDTPDRALIVRSNSGVMLGLEGPSSPGLRIASDNSNALGTSWSMFQDSVSGDLIFRDSFDGITRMAIDSVNGRIGIGTTTPDSTLDVAGKGTFDSGIDAGGRSRFGFLGFPEISATVDIVGRPEDTFALVVEDPSGIYRFSVNNNGNVATQCGIICASDERLKEDIVDLESPLDKIMALRDVTFTWKDETLAKRGTQIGFVAQEVQKVLPELIGETPDGFLGVDYASMAPVLVGGIQEQQSQIDTMQSQIADLQAQIESLQNHRSMTGASMIWPALIGGGLVGGIALARRRMHNA